jgi:glycosyltransferase involved in cell wall biosynthesis
LADKFSQEEIQLVRKKFSNNKNGFLIGYTGRLVPSKAQDMAIQALKIVRDQGVDGFLVFIGEGYLTEEKRYEALLRRLTEKLNIGRYVYFLGYQNDVLSYMKAMNVLVLTSKYEGLPNIAVEAGIVGRPLVAFKVCGISEVIENEETGYIVEQGNVKAMAERLIFLAKNPTVTEDMGHKANLKVRNLYTMERMIEEKLRFYESILTKNNKAINSPARNKIDF